MNAIREDIARRLAVVRRREMEAITASPDRLNARAFLAVDRAVTEECIRQMEWARRECPGVNIEDDCGDLTNVFAWPDLTAAPEGWKP